MRHPTPEMLRGLARSSPWRWRALSFELHRRPLHGPDHVVLGRLVRGVGLEVRLASGERHWQEATRGGSWWRSEDGRSGTSEPTWRWEVPVEVDGDGFVVRRPADPLADDPMWQDYQFVAMLDPVELADGIPRHPGPHWRPDAVRPPALDVVRLDTTTRLGRETWWAEVSPREDYAPRCSCCPLLVGRVSTDLMVQGGGAAAFGEGPLPVLATAYLVALDVQTGVCVHVEHLDGDHVGRGFSLDVLGVDDETTTG
ncbi:MAG TPA: hypothetical protein VFI44_11010 [Ornithinibacter sp.]|nr:hypothetical protein [Ornithinibacter sp.]